MPFVRKTDSQGSQPPSDTRNLFIGRTGELLFFVQNILKPEEPTHNIISMWGQGGVGKSTLLARFIDEAHSADFKDYCLTATVDELQTTPASMMEKFATQLHLQGAFEKVLKRYKDTLRTLHTERETLQDTLVQRMPTFAGAAVEGVPFVGPLLGEGVKATTEHLLDRHYNVQRRKDVEQLEDPINELTRAFVEELNRLTNTQVSLSSGRAKNRRVILFFDTFEQLAIEAVPWLLDYFLPADIKSNVVLVIAGRDPIERSIPDATKRWLPYCDNETIYWIPLNNFTEDETRAYLIKRNITDPERITTIWQLSQGLPLYLSLLTSNPRGKVDPTADVVANFLRWIPKQEQTKRQLALDASLFSRPFNQDDLAAFAYLPENDRPSLYHWLLGQPFVRPQDGRYSYHDLARELFSRHLYQRSKKGYYATRRALVNHYQQLLEEIQMEESKEVHPSAEWLELELALAQQLLLLPDEVSHIKAIEQVVQASKFTEREQTGEIARVLRELSQEQPNNHANADAQQTAGHLLQYIEGNQESREFLTAANYLLEKVVREPAFSAELLAGVYYKRGRVYMNLNKYQRAISDFDRALELNPSYVRAYINRGWAYFGLKEYHEVIANFDRALELDPNNDWVYYDLGQIYRNLNEYQQAITKFDHFLELNSISPIIYNGRGRTHWLFKKYRQAVADFDRALELDPNYLQAYLDRGRAYMSLGEYRQAIEDFNHALELNPNSIAAYIGRGQSYNSLQVYQLAIDDFNYALELDPQSPWAYHNLARAYMELKEYQQAAENFERTIALDPKYNWAYEGRGMAYLWLKDIKRAKSNYMSGLELDPVTTAQRGGWARIIYAWMAEWTDMCQERPDPGKAKQLEMIAATDPEKPVAFVCRGVAMWLGRHFDEALQELERAIQRMPKSWDPYFWKGMTCASLGREEEAKAAIQKALELELPPVLLTPLLWLEQDRLVFYRRYVILLMVRYDLPPRFGHLWGQK